MSDGNPELDRVDALNELHDRTGQTYILSNNAMTLLRPFATAMTPEFADEWTHIDASENTEEVSQDVGELAFSTAIADRQRTAEDARGIVSVMPHETVLTYSDVSAILAAALGGEESDHTSLGSGFTADGRHDEQMQTVEDCLNVLDVEE